jgi:hypothetical protein
MKEGGGDGGFVRADQIDLKSLDEQLERHLSRAWTMEKRKEEAAADQRGSKPPALAAAHYSQNRRQRREEWEIDPAKLVVRGVIARGTFGTVHRGVYDGHDVAGAPARARHFSQFFYLIPTTAISMHSLAPVRCSTKSRCQCGADGEWNRRSLSWPLGCSFSLPLLVNCGS